MICAGVSVEVAGRRIAEADVAIGKLQRRALRNLDADTGVQSPGEGRGSTVTVELPVASPGGLMLDPGAPAPASVPHQPLTELSGVTVLVVDDQADARNGR